MKLNKKKLIIFLSIVAVSSSILLYTLNKDKNPANAHQKNNKQEILEENKFNEVLLKIEPKSTYGELMKKAQICPATSTLIFEASKEIYDLSKIRVGRELKLFQNKKTDKLEKLIYQIDSEEELCISLQENKTWQAEKKKINYEIKVKTSAGIIESSLYETGLEQGLDEVAIIELANVFQWTIDFAMNIRKGDSFKFIYEERYLNGEYIMPGNILAAKFLNNGKEYQAYYFEDEEKNYGYFNEVGESMQKIFLKAPVSYKYISSGFTTGSRYVQAFNVSTKHRAIDYAAPYGTPIKAVGDGTIIRASWYGGYGNFISLRHNSTYTTNYGHLSKYAVKYNQKVEQGDIIGYVGSTGFSTGPHVHYEMVKNGTKINPQAEDFPNTDSIKEKDKNTFTEIVNKYQKQL